MKPWARSSNPVSSDWWTGADFTKPSSARMYDYYLGGFHNFAVDRAAANRVLAIRPEIALMARANRAFLRRVVRYLAQAGIRQFLDVGSGIPTVGNVHEIAHRHAPGARVIYVDSDSVAVAQSGRILAGNELVTMVVGDVLQPQAILDNPEVHRLLDLGEPVGLLTVSVLHFASDEEVYDAVRQLCDQLAEGSYLAVSHVASETFIGNDLAQLRAIYNETTSPGGRPRSWDEIGRFLTGLQLVEPGLVWLSQWRPDPGDEIPEDPQQSGMFGGLGVKRPLPA